MATLADHWGGSYLGTGTHVVTVQKLDRMFTCNTGTPGVEYILQDDCGDTIKASFILHDKALWKLAAFAKACGLTRDEARTIDPTSQAGLSRFVGKRCQVVVVKDGDYHRADKFIPLGAVAQAPRVEVHTPAISEAHPEMASTTDGGSDAIPF